MVKLEHVSKSYDGKTLAVDDLSLEIQDGEIFGLLGHNGAGKTTALKMLTGILPPDSGTIEIGGVSIAKDPMKAKSLFGYVPDTPDIFLKLKGLEYLNLMADIYGVSPALRAERIRSMADTFEISDVLKSSMQSYSHGMRQKLVLMGALLHDPKVWILDEPMTGLDPKSSFTLKEWMRGHADKGSTVIFSTHVLEVAEKLCDRLAIISHGKLLFCGSMQNLRDTVQSDGSLEAIFLELTENKQAKEG